MPAQALVPFLIFSDSEDAIYRALTSGDTTSLSKRGVLEFRGAPKGMPGNNFHSLGILTAQGSFAMSHPSDLELVMQDILICLVLYRGT